MRLNSHIHVQRLYFFLQVRGSVGKSKTFLVWDVGGQEKLRPLWKPYTRATDGIIFVVDSCDSEERLEEAKLELHRILRTPDNAEVPILVIANKQDLPTARYHQPTT